MKADADIGFSKRISTLIDRVGSVTELARKSRLSRRVIDNYKAGLADPSRSRLIALARAADVSLVWLATGQGEMLREGEPASATAPAALDEQLMQLVITTTEAWLAERALAVPPADKGKLMLAIYRVAKRRQSPDQADIQETLEDLGILYG